MCETSKNSSASQGSDEFQRLSKSESDFWTWFRPSLAENWMRGVVGEYWVTKALGLTDKMRKGWNSWDIETPDRIRIEVKTTGYRQSWHKPTDKMAIPKFVVPKVKVKADESRGLRQRQYRPAHLYVLCFHKEKDVDNLDPLDTSQWEFYVVPTTVIDEKVNPNAKSPSINLRFLSENSFDPVSFNGLKDAIFRAAKL